MEALKLMTTNSQENKSTRLSARVEGLDKRHANCSFTNFDVNPQNQKQFEICKAWDGTESLTLTGKTGTGKTHLAIAMLKGLPPKLLPEDEWRAIENRLVIDIEKNVERYDGNGRKYTSEYYQKILDSGTYKYKAARGLIISVVEMFVQLNEASMKDGKLSLLEKYAGGSYYDCICFDDLGSEKLTDAKRENLYYIIDSRYRNMLPTLITTNYTIEEIDDNEPRIASRLCEMGKILYFSGKDYRLGGNKN